MRLWTIGSVTLLFGSIPVEAQLTWGPGGVGGSGTWDGTTANWYNGSANVTWAPGDTATFMNGGAMIAVSGTQTTSQLSFNAPGYLLSGGTIQGTSSGLTIQTNGTVTINSALNGVSATTLTLSGFGGLTLNGGNTFSQVTITGGNLTLGSSISAGNEAFYDLSNSGGVGITLAAGGGQSYVLGGLNGGGTSGGNIAPNNASIGTSTIVLAGTGTASYSGVLQDAGPSILAVTIVGTNQTFTGNNAYSGATQINSGTLTLAGAGAILNSAITVVGGTFEIDDSSVNDPNRLSPIAAFSMSGGTFLFQGNSTSASTELAGRLTLVGGGSTVTVNAGTSQTAVVTFNNASRAIGGGTVNFSGTGTSQLSGTANTNGILGSYATVNGVDWATVDGSGHVSAYNSYATNLNTATASSNVKLIVGTASLNSSGTINSLNLQNLGSGTGALNLGANTLTVASGGILSSGSGATAIQNGTLTSSSGEFIVTNENMETISANVTNSSSSVGLTKSGVGILNLSGNNTYTGTTTIDQGTLGLTGPSALPTNTVVNAAGGSLALNNFSSVVGGFTGSGSVTLGSATLLLHTTVSPSYIYSGSISGTGGITKTGSATETLTGTNTYTGSTVISGGTLSLVEGNVGTGSVLASSTPVTLGGGTLALDTVQVGMTQQLGTLSLQGNSTINFANSLNLTFNLAFADSSTQTWGTNQLVIENWNPTIDTLRFGTSDLALTSLQLSDISFQGYSGSFAELDPNGNLEMVPEPDTATLALSGFLLLAGIFHFRSRRPRSLP